MTKLILRDRMGNALILNDLSVLPHEQRQRVLAHDALTYRNKRYTFKMITNTGIVTYLEQPSWRDLHPLLQLDKALRRGGAR